VTAGAVAAWVGAAVAVLTLAGIVWPTGARIARRIDEVVDDWHGESARPGVPARPGVMERLERIEGATARIEPLAGGVAAIEHELHPNGGDSLRDAVNRVDLRTRQIAGGG